MKKIIMTYPNLFELDITNKTATGFSALEILDYELDYGTITLPFTKRKDPYPLWSIIDIYEDETIIESFRIQDDFVEISSKSPLLYKHTFSVIEHTKLLEKFFIGGKTYTQPIGNGVKLTLLDVIEDLITVTPFELEELVSINRIVEGIDKQILLDSIISPEFTFNSNTTLREALNDVYAYIDAVPVLTRDNVLTLKFFNETKNKINDELGIVDNIRQQNIEYYSTGLISDLLNTVSQEENIETEIYPSKNLFVGCRTETLLFDKERAYIPTPKKIYKIDKVETQHVYSLEKLVNGLWQTLISNQSRVFDISSQIVEKQLYNTFPTEIQDQIGGYIDEQSKPMNIHYTYGNRNIFVGETFGTFGLNTAYNNTILVGSCLSLISQLIEENFLPNHNYKILNVVTQLGGKTVIFEDLDDLVENVEEILVPQRYSFILESFEQNEPRLGNFRVYYKPIPDTIRFNIDREDISELNLKTELIVNQKDRILNTKSFLDNMYGRVNKIGNVEYQLSHRVNSLENSFNIGDFTEDGYIISKKEKIYFKDYIFVKYELTKNFNKLSGFIGINSQVRQWEIGESGRTLERNLNYKEYIQLSLTEFGLNEIKTLNKDKVLETFDKTIENSFNVNYGIFRGIGEDVNEEIPTVLAPITKSIGGNNISFSFEFDDNKSAGDKVLVDEGLFIDRYFSEFVPYTDFVGKLDRFSLSMYHDIGGLENSQDYLQEIPQIPSSFANAEAVVDGMWRVNKDSREVLKMNVQYQFLGDYDIIIGEQLTKGNNIVVNDKDTIFKCYIYNNKTFSKQSINNAFKIGLLDGYDTLVNDVNIIVDYQLNTITIDTNQIVANTKSYVITDSNDNVYFAVNSNEKTIAFNFLNERKDIIKPNIPLINIEINASFNGITATIVSKYLKIYQGNISANLNGFNATITGEYIYKLYQGNIDAELVNQLNATMNGNYSSKIYSGNIVAQFDSFTATLISTYLKPTFDFIGTSETTQDHTLTYLVQGTSSVDCPSTAQVTNWLNNTQNPSNYNLGDIIRVQTFVVDGEFPIATCNEFFYEVILSA